MYTTDKPRPTNKQQQAGGRAGHGGGRRLLHGVGPRGLFAIAWSCLGCLVHVGCHVNSLMRNKKRELVLKNIGCEKVTTRPKNNMLLRRPCTLWISEGLTRKLWIDYDLTRKLRVWLESFRGFDLTPNLPTIIVDFRGFDSSIILI